MSVSSWAVSVVQEEPRMLRSPMPAPVDITRRVVAEAFGRINRAVERDFLSFRSGDLTLMLRDGDGAMRALFSLLGKDDRWTLTVDVDGVRQFLGVILGVGSVAVLRRERRVELTAYGATRILADTAADGVARTFGSITVTSGNSGSDQLVVSSTVGMYERDGLHLDAQTHSEDVVVLSVDSATALTLAEPLANTYAALDLVTVLTPGYRFRSVDFLIREVAAEAEVPVAEIVLSGSTLASPAPSPLSREAFPWDQPNLAGGIMSAPCERLGRQYQTIWNSGDASQEGTWYLDSPSGAWVKEDASLLEWYDWSKYFRSDEAGPGFIMRRPVSVSLHFLQPDVAIDYRPAVTKRVFKTSTSQVYRRETTDGTTYGAETLDIDGSGAGTLPPNGPVAFTQIEYDHVNDSMYVTGSRVATTRGVLLYWDYGAGAWTELSTPAEEAVGTSGVVWYAPTWCEDTETLYVTKAVPVSALVFDLFIVAFRAGVRQWERPLPRTVFPTNQNVGVGSGLSSLNHVTTFLRWIDGYLVTLIPTDGEIRFAWTRDEFVTLRRARVSAGPPDAGSVIQNRRAFWGIEAGRIAGTYRFNHTTDLGQVSSEQHRRVAMFVAATFYAGVVDLFDTQEKSAAESLASLAVLTNSVFWLDEAGALHVVARDLIPADPVVDLTGRIITQRDDLIWNQVVQFVRVSGQAGSEYAAGNISFSGESAEVSGDLIPNDAYGQALADALFLFLGAERVYRDVEARNPGNEVFSLLRRVLVDGAHYRIYESEADVIGRRARLSLLEEV